ncbi:MAG: hypothetical protein ACLP05_13710 [Candidatus Kryptoniota bacterium]
MKFSSNVFAGTAFVLILSSSGAGQQNHFTLITMARDTLNGCESDSLTDSLIYFTCGALGSSIPVDSIALLMRHRGSHFWAGAGIGTAAGAVTGFIIGYASYQKPAGQQIDLGPGLGGLGGAIIFAPAGFIIGGVIGAVSGNDDVCDLSQRSHDDKIKLARLFLYQGN